jgi:hypothetical protein
MSKRKIRTAQEVLKDQEEMAKAERENAVAVRKGSTALVADNDNPWLEMSTALDRVLGLPRIKFLDGHFMISETEEVPLGTKVIARASECEYGWKCWQSNTVVDKRWGRMIHRYTPPTEDELPNNDPIKAPDGSSKRPWAFSMAVPIVILSKDGQLGETYALDMSSKGGLNAMRSLTRLYGRRVDEGKPGEPICELAADKYFHKVHQCWVDYPIFRHVSWTDKDGKPLSAGEDLNDEIPI